MEPYRFPSRFKWKVLSLTLWEQGLEKKMFILSTEDLQILCCPYLRHFLKRNQFCHEVIPADISAEAWSQWRTQSCSLSQHCSALLMSPTSLQISDLPNITFHTLPVLLHMQHNIDCKTSQMLLPQRWVRCFPLSDHHFAPSWHFFCGLLLLPGLHCGSSYQFTSDDFTSNVFANK